MFSVHVDVPVARRIALSVCYNHADERVRTEKTFRAMLEWLIEQEITEVMLWSNGQAWKACFQPTAEPRFIPGVEVEETEPVDGSE